MSLTRLDLENGRLQQLILQANLTIYPLTEAELQASLHQTLQKNPSDSIWLFAYGSLIWNPIIHFVDRRVGAVQGFHRRFCLWTPAGRGTSENPGLVLGLDRGGSCRGVIYQIAAEVAEAELILVWRREMVVGSYVPRWVKVISGEQSLYAITFVVNRAHRSYAGNLTPETVVEHIATASGALGTCADYLNQTVNSLAQAGIRDRRLLLLQQQVLAKQQSIGSSEGTE